MLRKTYSQNLTLDRIVHYLDSKLCLKTHDSIHESFLLKQLKKKIDLNVVDARQLTKHGSDSYTLLTSKKSFAKKKPLKFLNLKSKGYYPSYEAMFNSEIIDIVKKEYADDIKLYKSKFGAKNLLFQ